MERKISEITDNCENKVKVFINLEVGDKLRAKKKVKSRDDFGASGLTFEYDAFIPNNIYEVKKTCRWDFKLIGYVSDESGTLHFATPDIFEIINK